MESDHKLESTMPAGIGGISLAAKTKIQCDIWKNNDMLLLLLAQALSYFLTLFLSKENDYQQIIGEIF